MGNRSSVNVSTSGHAPADATDLAAAMVRMSSCASRDDLLSLACSACGLLLDFDAVVAVHAPESGPAVSDARWARHGARPSRVGEARIAAGVELIRERGGPVAQRTFGRLQLIAIPVPVTDGPAHAIIATAPAGRLLTDADAARAQAIATHLAACLAMVRAVTAAREYMMLEQSVDASADASRGDRALDQIRLIQTLSGALSGLRSLAEVGQVVVSRLRSLIDYHSCRFYVRSPDGLQLLPVAHIGLGPAYADENAEDLICAVGEGITGRAFEEGRPVRIDDASSVPHSVEIAGTERMDESMLVAPMVTESAPVGVIVLSHEGLNRFDDDDLRLLDTVAGLAAMACDNVRLFAEQRDAAEVAEALLQVGGALAAQQKYEDIAAMLAAAIYRLVECAATSVWRREGDVLVPVASMGYTPLEERRLMDARLRVESGPLAAALSSRRIAELDLDQQPVLTGCLDAAPAGTTFAVVAIGERAANRGAVVVQRGPRRGSVSRRDHELLLGVADQALLAMTNRALFDALDESFLATVEALGNALGAKDEYTQGHAKALVSLSSDVAVRMGVSGEALRDISYAAALHDIGKIGIPAEILNKPGPLTDEEFEVMKLHPELGAQILEPVPALAGAAALVIACHEHFDGSGYPLGLSGTDIPLGARVILACDAYDAMTSDRVYRKAMSHAQAVAELRRCSGTHFDPQVVDVLVAVVAAAAAR